MVSTIVGSGRAESDLTSQCQNVSSRALGKGALKSSGTLKSPLAQPSTRFIFSCSAFTATNFATGLPAFVMMTFSPWNAISSRRERRLLASLRSICGSSQRELFLLGFCLLGQFLNVLVEFLHDLFGILLNEGGGNLHGFGGHGGHFP